MFFFFFCGRGVTVREGVFIRRNMVLLILKAPFTTTVAFVASVYQIRLQKMGSLILHRAFY